METKKTITEYKGCSPVQLEKDFITGWILNFYGKAEIKKEKLRDLNEEVLEAPVTIEEKNTGKTKSAVIYAGIRDLKQDPITFIVEPIVNYCFSIDSHFHSKTLKE